MYLSRLVRSALAAAVVFSLVPMFLVSALPATAASNAFATDQSTVVVKLKAGADADLLGTTFVSSNKQADEQLNDTLSSSRVVSKKRLINEDRQTVKHRRAAGAVKRQLAPNQGDLENYYVLKLAPGQKAADAVRKLKTLDIVETAYAKPLPAPAPVIAPDFSSQQRYFANAPTGLGLSGVIGDSTLLYPGVRGDTVQIADLEYAWNTQHEDVSDLRKSGALWSNGTPLNPFTDTNHGTAVAGMISADVNQRGMNGIVPNSSFHIVNTNSVEGGWNVAGAIYTAASRMVAGDVILIEQQAWAPDQSGFAPIEIYPEVYDAISHATAKGIIVIEPAGNGRLDRSEGYDLSAPLFGGVFTAARAHSGALIIGAGATDRCSTLPARTRLSYSNYGSRVDLQGPGDCVSSTGYGDLFTGSGQNTWYTKTFNGTSSASAAVASAAAAFSSSYKAVNGGALSPAAIKNGLLTGASAQNNTRNAGKIGPLPNLTAALRLTDITKPGAPTRLTGTATYRKISLSWSAASDNLPYVTYHVYRNNVRIATTTGTTYSDQSVRSWTNYTYYIVAADASDNRSSASNSITVRSH
jgi:serine protease